MDPLNNPAAPTADSQLAPNSSMASKDSGEAPSSNFPKQIRPAHVGGRGKGRGNSRGRGGRGSRDKKQDMGRAEWSRNPVDKRARNDAAQEAAKRRKITNDRNEKPIYAVEFSKEEIENDERKPKRKVAVMIGYSGSGYKGMQLNNQEKTIEGDLFGAFVAAGAVSKANANDPKKSSLVRCARTDKGVHAAGNIISMKLIVEDEDIVKKINDNLSPQIRVWGMERTNRSFSAYQMCDSRIYEYLIPTHCFLPPHPESFLGKKLVELAEEAGDREGFEGRQQDVSSFWAETEAHYIKPILDRLDPSIRPLVTKALYTTTPERESKKMAPQAEKGLQFPNGESTPSQNIDPNTEPDNTNTKDVTLSKVGVLPASISTALDEPSTSIESHDETAFDTTIKDLKAAYIAAKNAYRIHPSRLNRVQSILSSYLGTRNYYNYTIQKSYRDASAKRIIKSFVVNPTPILINGTEWLSLKVHGQSFMMHQIRKMVSMLAMVIRCGCSESRIQDSYGPEKISIPKAPGLGLLLERPVFNTYNENLGEESEKKSIGFTKYEKEMQEFKQREIYERIFREEEKENQFHSLFATHDNMKSAQLLYLSSIGIPATKRDIANLTATAEEVEQVVDDASSEDDNPEDG